MSLRRQTTANAAQGQHAHGARWVGSASLPAPKWVAPLLTMRQALTSTMFKVLSCRSATAPEYTTLRGRMRAFRRLDVAYGRLVAASDQLGRATAALRATIDAVTAEPERAGNAAAEVALGAREIFVLTARVAEMSLELDAAAALVEECRKIIGRPRPLPDWLCSRYPIDPLQRIRLLLELLRRRRSRCQAIEDAPRRVSRGRAPPFASTCSL